MSELDVIGRTGLVTDEVQPQQELRRSAIVSQRFHDFPARFVPFCEGQS